MIRLTEATDMKRDEHGQVYAWRSGRIIAEFKLVRDFITYINNLEKVDHLMVEAGSASLLSLCSQYLGLRRQGELIHDYEDI